MRRAPRIRILMIIGLAAIAIAAGAARRAIAAGRKASVRVDPAVIELVNQGRIRWSKLAGDATVSVEIEGGEAKRTNPGWSPQPMRLGYDLGQERALWQAIRDAGLGHAQGRAEPRSGERALELWRRERDGSWTPIGAWSLPLKQWQRGRRAALYQQLEPLLEAHPIEFDTVKSEPR